MHTERIDAPRAARPTEPPPSVAPRWTLAGAAELEARVTRDLTQISDAAERVLGRDLRALLLVGGYARGEGGAERRQGSWAPHNDYDLLAVTARGGLRGASAARRFSEVWTQRLGLHVDLTPVPLARLLDPPRTLFWLDVTAGGARTLAGDPSLLSAMPWFTPRDVPFEEAGRLLMNRAVGLALSRLAGWDEEPVVRARHVHKAVLACGDALLFAADQYPRDLAGRLRALVRLQSAPGVGVELVDAYTDALAFRLDAAGWRPRGGDVEGWWRQSLALVAERHLRFEAWRAGTPRVPAAYVSFRGPLFPALPDVRVRLPWLAAVRARVAGAASLTPYLGHPRERLARVAVALAYGGAGERESAAVLLGAPRAASDAALIVRLRALSARGS